MTATKTTKEKIPEKYVEAIGRRKTSTARVRLSPASKTVFTINDVDLATYFPTEELRHVAKGALRVVPDQSFKVVAKIKGGGIHSQVEALRHGISNALSKQDESLRKSLKVLGFLKRDPRAKERRKFGLKKARKAPQWSKR